MDIVAELQRRLREEAGHLVPAYKAARDSLAPILKKYEPLFLAVFPGAPDSGDDATFAAEKMAESLGLGTEMSDELWGITVGYDMQQHPATPKPPQKACKKSRRKNC